MRILITSLNNGWRIIEGDFKGKIDNTIMAYLSRRVGKLAEAGKLATRLHKETDSIKPPLFHKELTIRFKKRVRIRLTEGGLKNEYINALLL